MFQIVAVYLLVSIVLAALLSVVLCVRRGLFKPYEMFETTVLMLLNPGSLFLPGNDSVLDYGIIAVGALARILLPVFLLGAFVFKLFKVDPLTWRSKLSIEDYLSSEGESPVLRVRFYNSTAAALVNVTIQIFARIHSTGTPRVVRNIALNVAQGEDLPVTDKAFWAYSRPGVPFTVNVPLGNDLSARQVVSSGFVDIPGVREAIRCNRVKLFVLATGTNLETGTSFHSGREYDLTEDLLLGHYGEIDVVYDELPQSWNGWQNFEENSELFVFGYASLVSPDSVAQTLGHPVDSSRFVYARLENWVREWSVGSDRTSHPERTFIRPDGSQFNGVTVVMGLQERKGEHCDGAVFPVTRSDLSVLDVRERNYLRIDVTDLVTWAGKPATCAVFTYRPLDESITRLAEAKASRREINVRAGYLDLIREAFSREGYSVDKPEFRDIPFPVEDLRIEIDPALRPTSRATLSSSYFQDRADIGLPDRDSGATELDSL